MKPIYLSRVGISNFRTYGEDFTLDLPDGPGLTVICGMNGLGKTAFFDAVEWALLGGIQRLSADRLGKPEGNPLTREGAATGSHRVELSWGGDHMVARDAEAIPDPAQLTALLKDPDWAPQIHDLAVYLRLTHFLPQASRERFLERDGKAQWSLLQGPAGVERLERLRKMLDDGKARKAFDRRVFALDTFRTEAERRMEEWQKLLSEQGRWANVASAAAAVSPDELERVLGELASSVPTAQPNAVPNDPVQRLAGIRTAVEKVVASLGDRRRALSRLEPTTRRYGELAQRIRTMQETQANAPRAADDIRRDQEDAKAKVASERAGAADLEARIAAANRLSLSALVALDAESRRAAAANERAALDEKIKGWNRQMADLEQRRAVHRRQREDYDTAAAGMETVRQSLRTLAQTEQAVAAFAQAAADYRAEGKEALALAERKGVLSARKTSLEQTVSMLAAKTKEVTERLGAEQRSFDEATRALGVVVRHLQADDTVCPVCAQVHPAGELLRKARGSMERYGSRAAALLEELRKLQDEAEEASRAQAQCAREAAEVEAALGALASREAEVERRRSALLQRPEIAGVGLEELPAFLKAREAALRLQELDFAAKVAVARISDELALAAQRYDGEEKNLRGDLQAANEGLGRAEGVLQECAAKLATSAEVVAAAGGLAGLQDYRNERLRDAAQLESELREQRGRLEEHEKRLQAIAAADSALVAKREADEKLLAELRAESARLLSSWGELPLEGEPNESAVQEALAEVDKLVGENQKALDRVERTVAGVEAWAQRTQLTALERAVSESIEHAGASTKEQCTAILRQRFDAQTAALHRAQAAQKRAEDVARNLTELTGRFSATALEPLSARISAFNRLISPFPYDFRLSPHVTATRTSTQARVTIPSVRSNRALERDPEWWLSEGQMSAMGLSVLLGASTVYRWSRWRALLLDDPLQNTDLIHAAAFGDVIRSLMIDEGFQVIVSSHDYDEADYLIRKCRRANLPVRRLELLSLGPTGLRYNVRES